MKVSLERVSIVLLITALSCLVLVDCRGGRGGGSRGGGVGTSVVVSKGGHGTGFGGSGPSSHKGIRGGGAAVIGGGGAAGFVAYKAHRNAMKEREGEDPSYHKNSASDGIGMSAWTLSFLILMFIDVETIG